MYNIDLYTYWKKPFTKGKKFTIHPLDEPGKEKYYSQESHCTHYLKRADPFVFKSIMGIDYDTLVKLQQNDIETLKSIRSSKDKNTLSKSIDKNIDIGKHVSNYTPNEENEKKLKKKEGQCNNRYNTYGNDEDIGNMKKFRSFNNLKNFKPYHRERNFKDIYGYENISTLKSNKDKYLNLINNIKYGDLQNGTKSYVFQSREIPLRGIYASTISSIFARISSSLTVFFFLDVFFIFVVLSTVFASFVFCSFLLLSFSAICASRLTIILSFISY